MTATDTLSTQRRGIRGLRSRPLEAVDLIPLIYVVLSLLYFRHLIADPSRRVVAGNPTDSSLIGYLLQAEPSALVHGHNPLYLPGLNHPDGVASMWNTGLLLPALVLAPLTLWLGGTFTFSLLLVVSLPASAWALYTVSRRYLRYRAPAFVAGLVFGFSPAMTHQATGHLHLVFLVFVPFLLDGLIQVLVNPYSRGRSVRLGLLAVAQLLTGEEMLACAVICGTVMTVVIWASRPILPAVRGLLTAAGTFAVVALVPLGYQLFGARVEYGTPFTPDVFKSDLSSFVTPDQALLFHGGGVHVSPGGVPEQSAYLGWPLVILAFVIMVVRWADLRVRVVGVAAMFLGLLSLGDHILVSGHTSSVRGPWHYLAHLPLLEGLLANRFGLFVAGLVGLLLAFGLDAVIARQPTPAGRRRNRIVLPLAGVLVLLPLVPAAALAASPKPPVPRLISSHDSHRWLPSGSTVLFLPMASPVDTRAMDWQAEDGLRWSMPGGFFVGPYCSGKYCRGPARIFPSLRPTATLLAAIETGAQQPGAIQPQDRQIAKDDFAYWGISRIVVGPDAMQPALVAAIVGLTGEGGTRVDDSWVWTLG